MNDLDTNTLRRALRVTQDPGYPSPGGNGRADIAGIVARGRRLRWRRAFRRPGTLFCPWHRLRGCDCCLLRSCCSSWLVRGDATLGLVGERMNGYYARFFM